MTAGTLPLATCMLVVAMLAQAGEPAPSALLYGEPEVMKFNGGRPAAFSMQFDDSMDCHALFAIPATTGIKKADQNQLQIMLVPIVETWLSHKLKIIQNLFEEHITGDILRIADESIAEALQRINDLEDSLTACSKGAVPR